MKKYTQVFLLFIALIILVPSVTFASWWNPFSWFHKKINVSTLPSTVIQLPSKSGAAENQPQKSVVSKPKGNTDTMVALPVVQKVATETPSITTAECLKEKGVKFFGAYWCPHCLMQKSIFKTSLKDLPYIECSTPDGTAQTKICNDNNITSYPTWEFPDGTKLVGELSLSQLSEKTNCPINLGNEKDTTGNLIGSSSRECAGTTAPWLEITSPVNATTYTIGDTMHISWTSCNVQKGAKVQIMLGRGAMANSALPIAIGIAEGTANDGIFDFTIPNTYDSTYGGQPWGISLTTTGTSASLLPNITFNINTLPKIDEPDVNHSNKAQTY